MMPASPRCAVDHRVELLLARQARQDAVDQVRPVEAADEHERRRAGRAAARCPRARASVAVAVKACTTPAARRSRSAPSWRYSGRKSWPQWLMQWASSMATSGRRARHSPEAGAAVAHQPLGRDVEQLEAAVAQAVVGRLPLRRSTRAVEARRRDAAGDQAVDLVLHQRDQGRDDEREPVVADERRHLEAERLAAAGRQHDDAVAPLEHGADGRALQRPQRSRSPSSAAGRRRRRGQRLDGRADWRHGFPTLLAPTSCRPRSASSVPIFGAPGRRSNP